MITGLHNHVERWARIAIRLSTPKGKADLRYASAHGMCDCSGMRYRDVHGQTWAGLGRDCFCVGTCSSSVAQGIGTLPNQSEMPRRLHSRQGAGVEQMLVELRVHEEGGKTEVQRSDDSWLYVFYRVNCIKCSVLQRSKTPKVHPPVFCSLMPHLADFST